MSDQQKYDLFISYASEDGDFVTPLAEALQSVGLRVWYDKFTLQPGDSLSAKIHEGLSRSTFALVILSPYFFAKGWPAAELQALISLQNGDGQRRLIPVWHGVEREDVKNYNAFLLDIIAVQSRRGLQNMVAEILPVVRPDLQRGSLTPMPMMTAESPVAAAPTKKEEYDFAPYRLGEEGVPTDALAWQPYFVTQQPCLEVRFGGVQSIDFGGTKGKRWTSDFLVTNVGTGTARHVVIFLPCLAVRKADIIEPHATTDLGFICDDREAFWNHIKPPIQALMEYEDVSGVLYRQYGTMHQELVPSGAFYRFGFSDLGKPYRVKSRIIAPETPVGWIVKMPIQ